MRTGSLDVPNLETRSALVLALGQALGADQTDDADARRKVAGVTGIGEVTLCQLEGDGSQTLDGQLEPALSKIRGNVAVAELADRFEELFGKPVTTDNGSGSPEDAAAPPNGARRRSERKTGASPKQHNRRLVLSAVAAARGVESDAGLIVCRAVRDCLQGQGCTPLPAAATLYDQCWKADGAGLADDLVRAIETSLDRAPGTKHLARHASVLRAAYAPASKLRAADLRGGSATTETATAEATVTIVHVANGKARPRTSGAIASPLQLKLTVGINGETSGEFTIKLAGAKAGLPTVPSRDLEQLGRFVGDGVIFVYSDGRRQPFGGTPVHFDVQTEPGAVPCLCVKGVFSEPRRKS